MTTIHRGLMNAATQTPTDPAARLRMLQQRMQSRRQANPALARAQQAINPQPSAPMRPPAGMPPRSGSGQNTGIVPPHMQAPRGPTQASTVQPMPRPAQPPRPAPQGMGTAAVPQDLHPTMPGAPTADSAINPRPGGVMVPDVAKGPGFMAGFRS